ncbi:MAG: hypothetical protein ACE5KG_06065 [Nitrososphaerales archaeon]
MSDKRRRDLTKEIERVFFSLNEASDELIMFRAGEQHTDLHVESASTAIDKAKKRIHLALSEWVD